MPTTLARMLAATLLVAAGAAQAWSNHALITQAAFGPVAAEILGDIPNYTDIEPLTQISDVRV